MGYNTDWRTNGSHIPILSTINDAKYARMAVDVANTGFWEGTEFRISYEFNIPTATTQCFRFNSGSLDFLLQLQKLSVDQAAIRLRVYRSTQGVESGTWNESIPIYRQNFTQYTKDIDPVTVIDSGGVFTPNGGEAAVETLRVRSSGSTAQRTSISGDIADQRGIGAGVYYLCLENIANSTATGVFDLRWEELSEGN